MYKDPERQKQAVREATRRYRAKGITKVSQEQGITSEPDVIPVTKGSSIPDKTLAMVDKACGDTVNRHLLDKPKPQSYNPMMVGYVPPRR